MKTVYFPLFTDQTKSKKFSIYRTNPGVGGTPFTIINVAILLSINCPNWKIILVNSSKVEILEKTATNFEQMIFDTPSDFLNYLSEENSGVVIATVSFLSNIDLNLLKKQENRLICWSHHPFNRKLETIVKEVPVEGIVCVGIYQYFSNKTVNIPIYHIQNIFVIPQVAKKTAFIDKKQINIVHLGALYPAKGFLEIAKSWYELKKQFPNIKLHVIGSSETYGKQAGSKLIPTSAEYANQILKFIPEADINNGEVIFYGNLGEEKFDVIQQCDFAILNPTGRSEAFPASPLEVMTCGLPVIASDDYGMSDSMRFFPELAINGHQDIVNRVEFLVSDSLRYRELQQRAIAVAKWFDSQTDQIITRWIRLIDAVFENKEIDLSPIMPFYGSKVQLWYRRDIEPKIKPYQRYFNRGKRRIKSGIKKVLPL